MHIGIAHLAEVPTIEQRADQQLSSHIVLALLRHGKRQRSRVIRALHIELLLQIVPGAE